MTYNFTAAQVLGTVKDLAAKNPYFVYGQEAGTDECSYTSAGITYTYSDEGLGRDYIDGPACIVGQALTKLGVPFDELRKHDIGVEASGFVPIFASDKDEDMDTLGKLNRVQSKQDNGVPWGEAVE